MIQFKEQQLLCVTACLTSVRSVFWQRILLTCNVQGVPVTKIWGVLPVLMRRRFVNMVCRDEGTYEVKGCRGNTRSGLLPCGLGEGTATLRLTKMHMLQMIHRGLRLDETLVRAKQWKVDIVHGNWSVTKDVYVFGSLKTAAIERKKNRLGSRAGIAQSVQRLAAGWKVRRSNPGGG